MMSFIKILSILLLQASISYSLQFSPHVPTTQTGNLNNADFCENSQVGDEIYTLKLDDPSVTVSSYVIGPCSPEVGPCTGSFADYVEEIGSDGKIILKQKFKAIQNEYFRIDDVTARLADGSDVRYSGNNGIYMFIQEANDNEPIFSGLTYTENIYEYPWTPDVLATFQIRDDDADDTKNFNFVIPDAPAYYSVTQPSATNYADFEIKPVPEQHISFETNPVIFSTFSVEDHKAGDCGPTPTYTVEQDVIIRIKDGPDSPPVFVSFPGIVEVPEDTAINVPIAGAQVEAIDQDYGLSWEIEYRVDTMVDTFAISSDGKLSLKKALDRESQADNNGRLEVTISATEKVPEGDDPFQAMQLAVGYPFTVSRTMTITIQDVDDELPVFYKLQIPGDVDSKLEATSFSASLEEETSNGQIVQELNIYVEDGDEGSNAEFKVMILEANTPFSLSADDVFGGSIVNVKVADSSALDFDTGTTQVSFTIVATATDGVTELARATVTIDLTDANDNSPVFVGDLKFAISEDPTDSPVVGTLQAIDLDTDFGPISFGLAVENDYFEVATDGTITRKIPLDREQIPIHYLTFTATDSDGNGRVTSAAGEISVTDINDNDPEFLRAIYSTTVQEGGTFSLTMQAQDLDEGDNSAISFSIEDDDNKKYFEITSDSNANTATLTQSDLNPLDVESLQGECDFSDKHIQLVVTAADHGTPPRKSHVTVEITVQDQNDNPPIFDSLNLHEVSIPEKSGSGHVITLIRATDADACSPNNQLDFEIDEANSLDFKIVKDGLGGSLQVRNSDLDRDEQDSYDVVIIATDLGNPRTSATWTVKVILDDANDKDPEFVQSSYSQNIPEDKAIGEQVITLAATDTDSDSDLEYSITVTNCYDENNLPNDYCNDWFEITSVPAGEEKGGVVAVVNNLDRELSSKIELTIQVKDLNAMVGTNQIDTTLLVIDLDDINDQKPQFIDSGKFEVNENAADTKIGQVIATDGDVGENARITYSVVGEYVANIEINPDTGDFSTSDVPFDREGMGSPISVEFVATDNGIPPLSDTTFVDITLRDTNDQEPSITNLPDTITIAEDYEMDTEVFIVVATDEDEGINKELSYSIKENNLPFRIDQDTGSITVKDLLDYESHTSYTITVLVKDKGSPVVLSDEKILTVTITDVNDNKPQFTKEDQTQLITVPEGGKGLTAIPIEPAFDEDSAELRNNHYFVAGGTGKDKFDIDPDSRMISRTTEVDRDAEDAIQKYTLVIKVTDEVFDPSSQNFNCIEIESDSTYTCISITVSDINDNSPKFIEKEIDTDISQKPLVNSRIAYVEAIDLDEGENAKLTYSILSQTSTCEGAVEDIELFSIPEENRGEVFIIGTIQVGDTETKCDYTVNLHVRDNDTNHVDTATLKIGVVDDDEKVVLLSGLTTDEWNAGKKVGFENDFELILKNYMVRVGDITEDQDVNVIVDNVVLYDPDNTASTVKSTVAFHAKIDSENNLIASSTIESALDANTVEVNVFSATYSIQGKLTQDEVETNEDTTEIVLMVVIAALVLLIITLTISVVCMKQRITRNKKVERAMEQTFDDIEKQTRTRHGMPTNYKSNDNPLFDISGNQPTLDMDNIGYESTDDLNDDIDDNAIGSVFGDPEKEELPSSRESLSDDFAIDFANQDGKVNNMSLAAALSNAVEGDDLKGFGFEDTGF